MLLPEEPSVLINVGSKLIVVRSDEIMICCYLVKAETKPKAFRLWDGYTVIGFLGAQHLGVEASVLHGAESYSCLGMEDLYEGPGVLK